MLKRFCIKIISFYQCYISPNFSATCRYYPSCSEYSKQIFIFENPFIAVYKTLMRILSCNQLFQGGVSYPQVSLRIQVYFGNPNQIEYWLIPCRIQKYNPRNIPKGIYQSLQIQNVYIIKNYSKVSRV